VRIQPSHRDSIPFSTFPDDEGLPGTAVPGFLMPSLRDWGVVCSTVIVFR
jgi:hypothetical protein